MAVIKEGNKPEFLTEAQFSELKSWLGSPGGESAIDGRESVRKTVAKGEPSLGEITMALFNQLSGLAEEVQEGATHARRLLGWDEERQDKHEAVNGGPSEPTPDDLRTQLRRISVIISSIHEVQRRTNERLAQGI